MIYYTVRENMPRNISFYESCFLKNEITTNTVVKTYKNETVPDRFDIDIMLNNTKILLTGWINQYSFLLNQVNTDKHNYEKQLNFISEAKRGGMNEVEQKIFSEEKLKEEGLNFCHLYHTFYQPKKKEINGRIKWRRIDAPQDDLMRALKDFKNILENIMHGNTSHNSAFAYVQNRSIKDANIVHQKHASRYFCKVDLKDFFGSTTCDFSLQMLSRVYPFSEILKHSEIATMFKKILKVCFLDDKLPQGTPVSPLLTNILMIPIDYELTKACKSNLFVYSKNGIKHRFIYTRYADDIVISNRICFRPKKMNGEIYSNVKTKDNKTTTIEKFIKNVLKSFDTPYILNEDKTKYTSINGSNWQLGLLINQQGEVSLGHKERDILKATLFNYANRVFRENDTISISEGQRLLGKLQHHIHIENDRTFNIISRINKKFGCDLYKIIKFNCKRQLNIPTLIEFGIF